MRARNAIIDALGHSESASALLPALDAEIDILAIGGADFGPDLVALAGSAAGSTTPLSRARPDDIAMIHYTGGTTGRAKGAVRLPGNCKCLRAFRALERL